MSALLRSWAWSPSHDAGKHSCTLSKYFASSVNWLWVQLVWMGGGEVEGWPGLQRCLTRRSVPLVQITGQRAQRAKKTPKYPLSLRINALISFMSTSAQKANNVGVD